ncbi:hypothetical protein METHPM2_860007 [Pseudomonas sp. PM2]
MLPGRAGPALAAGAGGADCDYAAVLDVLPGGFEEVEADYVVVGLHSGSDGAEPRVVDGRDEGNAVCRLNVGAGLPAIAVYQQKLYLQINRHRRQASSHILNAFQQGEGEPA